MGCLSFCPLSLIFGSQCQETQRHKTSIGDYEDDVFFSDAYNATEVRVQFSEVTVHVLCAVAD